MSAVIRANIRLKPEVRRILYVRNLPFNVKDEDLFEVFGKFGTLRQVRVGNKAETKGTAFVVYDDIFDAKNACDHLAGFNFNGRYLIVLYYDKERSAKRKEDLKKQEEIEKLRMKYSTTRNEGAEGDKK
eukprot:TRINITY_DN5459_c0_g1_i1.p1 TRINITY_DN5459_c0_g1~~TRINITY_DN5459_c0_g1_i1.p1  ORF type:complete len:129 (+),score=26.45 TRINITY_DN5459_c0_g1_i1:66-452(+)